jgi:hypothetical protein
VAPQDVYFFISYTGPGTAWAECIAWQFAEAGFKVLLQAWHFGADSNVVGEMHRPRVTLDLKQANHDGVGLTEFQFCGQFVVWATDRPTSSYSLETLHFVCRKIEIL